MKDDKDIYDCIIIGAGPGGLQAGIHLARYNRRVLLVDRGGGRTMHARHIVNYLGLPEISGRDLIAAGLEQGKSFGVKVVKGSVTGVGKPDFFTVDTDAESYRGRFVIVSTGAVDHQPRLKNLGRFFGRGYYTCIDCDGHLTTGRKLVVMGSTLHAVHLAFGMKKMYTGDVALLLTGHSLSDDYRQALAEEDIPVYSGEPAALLGEDDLAAVQLADGRAIPCQVVMASFGWRLNDGFLAGLTLKRDHENFKILTNGSNESSLPGLYVVGALKTGHSQAIIAAGQGAIAAIDINRCLLEL